MDKQDFFKKILSELEEEDKKTAASLLPSLLKQDILKDSLDKKEESVDMTEARAKLAKILQRQIDTIGVEGLLDSLKNSRSNR